MAKNKTAQASAPAQPAAPVKAKGKVETLKTILIVMLITGMVAFIGGMQYQKNQQAQVQATVNAVATKK